VEALSDDLAAWIRAQLDEDERMATDGGRLRGDSWTAVERARPTTVLWDVVGSGRGQVAEAMAWEAQHIARHDPARTVREVDAKRRIVSLHEGRIPDVDGSDHCWICVQDPSTAIDPDPWPCTTLRLLALPYADREGFREEWKA
jgi:hypothetical protein